MPTGVTPSARTSSSSPLSRTTTRVGFLSSFVLPSACVTVRGKTPGPTTAPSLAVSLTAVENRRPPVATSRSPTPELLGFSGWPQAARSVSDDRTATTDVLFGRFGSSFFSGGGPAPADRDDQGRGRDGVFDDPAGHAEDVGDELGGEDAGGRALGGDPAVLHRDQVVAVAGGQVEVVEDDDDRPAVLGVQLGEQVEDLDLVGDVV